MKPLRVVLVTLVAVISPSAWSAPCAGFNDVQSTHIFCQNIAWLKNRQVTFGCVTDAYCPESPVSRLQMAAFMNRLGTALTPIELKSEQGGSLDLDLTPVVCQTSEYTVEHFPRTALLDLAFSGRAPAAVDVRADLVMSTNGGGTWTTLNTVPSRGTIAANAWGNVANLASRALDVDDKVRFGARVSRVAGSGDLSDSRCTVRATVINRN